MEKFGAFQVIEVLAREFDLVRGSCAFLDEAPDGFRIRGAQARAPANFVVTIKPPIADGDEVLAAKLPAVESSGDRLPTTPEGACFRFAHNASQQP